MLRGGLMLGSSAGLLDDALLAVELHCASVIKGSDLSLIDTIGGMTSSNHSNSIAQQIDAYRHCYTYFRTKMQLYGFIPATDIFRAHKYFTTYNKRYLSDIDFADAFITCAIEINTLLESAFTSQQEHHLFIKMAVLYIGLRFYETYPIDTLVLDAYFTCLLHKENLPGLPVCVSLYELLNAPYEGQSRPLDINQQVMDFLSHLENLFVRASLLLQKCEAEATLMRTALSPIVSAASLPGVMNVLATKLAFHNHDLERSALISNKTAIIYIRKLHENGYIESIKLGRETIHVKKQMLSYLEEGAFYGAQEP